MSRSLHTASTYQVHYAPAVMHGGERQDAFLSLFTLCDIYAEDSDEFEVQRCELLHLRGVIADEGDTDEEIIEILQKLKMTKEELLSALDKIITESDQSNEYVLLSWF